VAELIAGMFNASRYKRSQGRIARQLTFAAMVSVFAVAAWRLNTAAGTNFNQYVMPLLVLGAGAWASFRVVNLPKFADFLISVEAEMSKVSWPGRAELWRASMVVMFVIFLLAAILYTYDIVLGILLRMIFGI
jgi:preprotein translocase subunit SecE